MLKFDPVYGLRNGEYVLSYDHEYREAIIWYVKQCWKPLGILAASPPFTHVIILDETPYPINWEASKEHILKAKVREIANSA